MTLTRCVSRSAPTYCEDRVLDGPASKAKGSEGRNGFDCIRDHVRHDLKPMLLAWLVWLSRIGCAEALTQNSSQRELFWNGFLSNGIYHTKAVLSHVSSNCEVNFVGRSPF